MFNHKSNIDRRQRAAARARLHCTLVRTIQMVCALCIVVINAPSNSVYYGNLVAGPVFKEIAEKVYSSELGATAIKGSSSMKNAAPFSKSGASEQLINAFDDLKNAILSPIEAL